MCYREHEQIDGMTEVFRNYLEALRSMRQYIDDALLVGTLRNEVRDLPVWGVDGINEEDSAFKKWCEAMQKLPSDARSGIVFALIGLPHLDTIWLVAHLRKHPRDVELLDTAWLKCGAPDLFGIAPPTGTTFAAWVESFDFGASLESLHEEVKKYKSREASTTQ